jgi:hypothetical protein
LETEEERGECETVEEVEEVDEVDDGQLVNGFLAMC